MKKIILICLLSINMLISKNVTNVLFDLSRHFKITNKNENLNMSTKGTQVISEKEQSYIIELYLRYMWPRAKVLVDGDFNYVKYKEEDLEDLNYTFLLESSLFFHTNKNSLKNGACIKTDLDNKVEKTFIKSSLSFNNIFHRKIKWFSIDLDNSIGYSFAFQDNIKKGMDITDWVNDFKQPHWLQLSISHEFGFANFIFIGWNINVSTDFTITDPVLQLYRPKATVMITKFLGVTVYYEYYKLRGEASKEVKGLITVKY